MLEYVFSAPRGSLWLRLTPSLVGLSACGLFQVAIFQFVGRDRVPAGYFLERPVAFWWTILLPVAALTIAMGVHLRHVVARIPREASERRTAIAWSGIVWLLTAAFLAVQLVHGRGPALL